MPQEEREQVWADLSGNEKTSVFKKEVVENKEQIDKRLNEFQDEINSIREKAAYEVAEGQSKSYVHDRAFRLSFLRSCEYNGKKAARLLVEQMETKRHLFGDEVMGRDIRLSDLAPDDMATLRSGGIQFLRERDSAGRLVVYINMASLKFKEAKSFVSSNSVHHALSDYHRVPTNICLAVAGSILRVHVCFEG
jgi:hypothetical protein